LGFYNFSSYNKAKIGIFILLSSLGSHSYSQSNLSGIVSDTLGKAVAYANVQLLGTALTTYTDSNGKFEFQGITEGRYLLQISFIGYQTFKKELVLDGTQPKTLRIQLKMESIALNEVAIESKSVNKTLNEKALAISWLDFRTIQNSSDNPVSVLDRAAGLRVRQAGGLGSQLNISIQGAQDNAIRRYYDGLPIKYLGVGMDLNNLPVNQIDRIEIYRGVTPLEVGTDALGGGINIVPKSYYRNYFEASYQVGSFNTHQFSSNAAFFIKEDLYVGTNLYLNYSDNSYPIDAHDFNESTLKAENIIEVNRFHDRYRSRFAEVFLGLRSQNWADEFKIAFAFSDLYNEVQNGLVFNPVRPFGKLFNEQNPCTANLNYKKSFWY
jgi:hypothetical protein